MISFFCFFFFFIVLYKSNKSMAALSKPPIAVPNGLAYTNDEDPGLQALVELIIPELDEEAANNPNFRQLLCDSPVFNAEEHSSAQEPTVHIRPTSTQPSLQQINELKASQTPPTNHPWLSTNTSNELSQISFPMMSTPQTDDDMSLAPLMRNFFGTPSDSNPKKRRQSEPINSLTHMQQQTPRNDPMKDIEDLLVEMDDDQNGWIDFSEFEEAMQLIDNTMIHSEIEAIYDFMTADDTPDSHHLLRSESAVNTIQIQRKSLASRSRSLSSISEDNTDIGELNIKAFMEHIKTKYNEYIAEHKQEYNNNHHMMLRRVLSESNHTPYAIHNETDAKRVIRVVFGDLFDTKLMNQMEVTTTNLWGVQKGMDMSSLERLKKELNDEANGSNTLDLPEFESAMHNLGIQIEKRNGEEIVFGHFINAQAVSVTKHMHKRKELNIEFFIGYIETNLDAHQAMQPKEILERVFDDILVKKIPVEKSARSRVLLDIDDNEEDMLPEGSPNPYFDDGLISKDFAPDEMKKFENLHGVTSTKVVSTTESGRKLVRLNSALKWKGSELDDLEVQMKEQFELLSHAQNTENQSHQCVSVE
eukprot:1028354_1